MENQTTNVEPENKENNVIAPEQIAQPESDKEINWKKFREQREIERKQKLEAEKRANEKEAEATALKEAMEVLLNKTAQQNYSTEQDIDESEQQRIQRMVRESLDAERQKDHLNQQKKEQNEFPERLISNFSDFNQVCTSDNLDYLEYHYPEVADAFKELPDGYNKWSKIYKAVKRFVPNIDSKKESAKADKNFAKPQAMSIAGKTQVGDTAPQQLDDARRASNWQRMQKVMRGGS